MSEEFDTAMDELRKNAVPIRELIGNGDGLSDEYRETFKSADLVWGVDVSRNDPPTIFHGVGFLQDVVHGAGRGGGLVAKQIAVEYDQRTDELEMLGALCLSHRGGCDYGRPNRGKSKG